MEYDALRAYQLVSGAMDGMSWNGQGEQYKAYVDAQADSEDKQRAGRRGWRNRRCCSTGRAQHQTASRGCWRCAEAGGRLDMQRWMIADRDMEIGCARG